MPFAGDLGLCGAPVPKAAPDLAAALGFTGFTTLLGVFATGACSPFASFGLVSASLGTPASAGAGVSVGLDFSLEDTLSTAAVSMSSWLCVEEPAGGADSAAEVSASFLRRGGLNSSGTLIAFPTTTRFGSAAFFGDVVRFGDSSAFASFASTSTSSTLGAGLLTGPARGEVRPDIGALLSPAGVRTGVDTTGPGAVDAAGLGEVTARLGAAIVTEVRGDLVSVARGDVVTVEGPLIETGFFVTAALFGAALAATLAFGAALGAPVVVLVAVAAGASVAACFHGAFCAARTGLHGIRFERRGLEIL